MLRHYPAMLIRILIGVIGCSISLPLAAADFPEPYNTEEAETPPMSAEEVAQTAQLPEGFRLEVFASEPQVQQPISIAFDEQNRLWVAECYTFAERPLRWDLELSDRIIVLEDEDGDGKADKRTVFWDEGKRMTSAIPGHGGVWVVCAPQLLFIPDADNDLVPDGDPVVVLDGFDADTIGHNIVNGLKWGPDGWLYGRHGITATSHVGAPGTPESQRVALNCSIWRYDPKSKAFEVFCQGGTNPWGLDWDKNGQLFYTNTVIGHLWHGIPGAYYTRMFGTHLNRHAYELIPHTADHYHWDTGAEKWSDVRNGITDTSSALGGGHAHMGCLIYEGGVWPKEYQGDLFACNLHGRRVNRDHLEREGVGFVAHHGEDFLKIEDPWFRGLDLITGPDGQVWMNDWSDTGECHDNDAIHRTSGRIYRIVYDGPDKGTPTPRRADWLTSRADPNFGKKDIDVLLTSDHESKQAMGVRWLAEDSAGEKETLATLLKMAGDSPKPLVRLELAAALQRLKSEDRFALAEPLAQIAGDAGDRQQSLMIWYGVESVVPEFADLAVILTTNSKLPDLTRLIARRLTEDLEEAPEPVNELLSSAVNSDKGVRLAVLSGLVSGLEGWGKAPQPTGWNAFSASLASFPEAAEAAQSLAVLFGDGRARDELLVIVNDEEADPVARRSALENLLRQPDETLLPLLQKKINECHDNDAIHRTSGRIYRIVYDGPDKGTPTPRRADWLTSRADPNFGKKDIDVLLTSDHESKQAMGVRWLAEDSAGEKETLATLLKMAGDSPKPLVRLELAAALQRLKSEDRFALAEPLAQIAGDAGDRQQSLMIWYGVESVVPEFADLAVILTTNSKLPDLTRLIARRLTEDLEEAPEPVNELLSSAVNSDKGVRLAVLSGLVSGLEGWGKAPQPTGWNAFSASLASFPEAAEAAQSLAVLFGDGRARDELLVIVNDEEADPVARRSALENLLRQPDETLLPLLQKKINDRIIGLEVVRGLAAYDDPSIPRLVIGHWQRFPLNRGAAVNTLVSRSSYANVLFNAVENKSIPRDAITPFQARQVSSLNNKALNERLRKLWGEIRETPAEKKKEIQSWKALLTSETIEAADAKQGKVVFSQSCGACHKLYGEGGAIGPDLTGSDRHSIDYLLENTINPNDVVPADYLLTVFTMKDGRVVSGVIPEENEKTVTVQSAAERISLTVDEISKRETLPISLMPEGLLKALGEEAVKDLVAYLMTRGPVTNP